MIYVLQEGDNTLSNRERIPEQPAHWIFQLRFFSLREGQPGAPSLDKGGRGSLLGTTLYRTSRPLRSSDIDFMMSGFNPEMHRMEGVQLTYLQEMGAEEERMIQPYRRHLPDNLREDRSWRYIQVEILGVQRES